jgi:hypothetical protein
MNTETEHNLKCRSIKSSRPSECTLTKWDTTACGREYQARACSFRRHCRAHWWSKPGVLWGVANLSALGPVLCADPGGRAALQHVCIARSQPCMVKACPAESGTRARGTHAAAACRGPRLRCASTSASAVTAFRRSGLLATGVGSPGPGLKGVAKLKWKRTALRSCMVRGGRGGVSGVAQSGPAWWGGSARAASLPWCPAACRSGTWA